MPVISTLGAMSSRGFGEFNQQAQGNYIEDYFSTYLYTGTGAAQTINNGISFVTTSAWESKSVSQGSTSVIYNVTSDSSGNIYFCGTANNGSQQYMLWQKYNSTLTIQLNKAYYQSGNAFAYDITTDSSGNIYVCGQVSSQPTILKYNSSGTLLFQTKAVENGGNFRAVKVDSSGNVYCAGNDFDGARYYGLIAKFDSTGALVWQRKIYQNYAYLYGLVLDSGGNIYVSGEASDGMFGYALIAKYNTSGTLQWQRKLQESASSGRKLSIDSSDNLYVAAQATSGGTGYILVAKYDSSGTLLLQRKLAVNNDSGYSTAVDSLGNFYICGNTSTDIGIVAQYNSSGTLQWQRFITNSSNVNVYGIYPDSSGNVFIAGATNPNSSSTGFFSKLKSDGTTQAGSAYVTLLAGTASAATSTATSSTAAATATTAATTVSSLAGTNTTSGSTVTAYTQSSTNSTGGLVWMKGRSAATDHALYDTARGATFDLVSNTTAAQTTQSTGLTAFSASGFSIGALAKINTSAATYASWAFREQPKFFDIVTYTGNGANRTISHSLGSVPGMIIVKRTDTTGAWPIYHRSLANTQYLLLNTTGSRATGATYWNSTTATATEFSLGTAVDVNANGGTYVAYLFAHDAGGFGADGSKNVVSCGSFTTNASGIATVDLGYEPQFILWKENLSGTGRDWRLFDNMRGLSNNSFSVLAANTSAAEVSNVNYGVISSTGFITANLNTNATFYYLAIRRGPMRTPTSGTSVFKPIAYTGTGAVNNTTTDFVVDSVLLASRNSANGFFSTDRLRGNQEWPLNTWSNAAATSIGGNYIGFDSNTQFLIGANSINRINAPATTYVLEGLSRAPGFFDNLCYTGTGVNRTVSHNLNVVPELIIVKRRDAVGDWQVYSGSASEYLVFNTTAAKVTGNTDRWNNTAPTSSVFTVGTSATVNASGGTYVAYLFATCPGVSKVGSYTGTGATQSISCGFTGGARFVMIKRTDSTGDWYVWDTARGMVSGTDPSLLINSPITEVNANSVYTATGGFQIVSTAADINASGGTYIYLAIA